MKKNYLQKYGKKFKYVILFMTCFLFLFSFSVNAASVKAKLSFTKKIIALDTSVTLTMKNTNGNVTWSSSNTGVVVLKKAGRNKVRITAVGKGKVNVTGIASGSSKKYVCQITTYDPVKLNAASTSIAKGKSKILKVAGTKKTPVWSSSDNIIVSVKKTSKYQAKISAKAPGTAYISARVGVRTYSCKVTVKEAVKKIKIAVALSSQGEAERCVSALEKLGATAVIIKKNCNISGYDGLVLPGGTDINPSLYHQKNKGSRGISNTLDKFQYALLDKFVKAGKPVLGVCRGEQLINVYFGGTLKQNIKKHNGRSHATTIEPGTRMAKLYGSKLTVNSFHHQAVDKLGEGLKVTQRSADEIVEAVEHESLPVFGVQWHPENMSTKGRIVFKEFLNMCKEK